MIITRLGVCICSLRYSACNAHAPRCLMWPAPHCSILPHYLIKGTILEKKIIDHKMCVLIFSTTFAWNISHSKKKSTRYDRKIYIGLHVKYPLFLLDFNENLISSTNFEKSFNAKFHENPWNGNHVVPYGKTGMTKLILGFRIFAKEYKNGRLSSICFLQTSVSNGLMHLR